MRSSPARSSAADRANATEAGIDSIPIRNRSPSGATHNPDGDSLTLRDGSEISKSTRRENTFATILVVDNDNDNDNDWIR